MAAIKNIHNSTLLLVQGLGLIVLGIFLWIRPEEVFNKLVYVIGLFAAGFALVMLAKFFFGEERGRFFPEMFTAVMMMGMGILLLTGTEGTREWIQVALSGLFLLLSLNVFLIALEMRYTFKWWWLAALALVYSLVISYLLVSGKREGIPLSVLTGLQVVLLGLLMFWMSILDKKIEAEYRKTLRELRE